MDAVHLTLPQLRKLRDQVARIADWQARALDRARDWPPGDELRLNLERAAAESAELLATVAELIRLRAP